MSVVSTKNAVRQLRVRLKLLPVPAREGLLLECLVPTHQPFLMLDRLGARLTRREDRPMTATIYYPCPVSTARETAGKSAMLRSRWK